ncbi:sugar phosphate isomerase/epimerase family protein [Pseudochelatococcus sp. B33]
MKPLCLAHQSLIALPPLELIEAASAAGFSGVSLRTRAAAPGAPVHELPAGSQRLRAVRERAAALGIAIDGIETLALDGATTRDDWLRVLEVGAALGAGRLTVAGNDADFGALADRLAALAEDAAGHGIAVDLEFMPFRPVRGLAEALDILKRAGAANAHVLVDALHMVRSASPVSLLAETPAGLIGSFQLCDGPLAPPYPDDLPREARTERLLPGEGDFPLADMLKALPPATGIGVETPLSGAHRPIEPRAQARIMFEAAAGLLAATGG